MDRDGSRSHRFNADTTSPRRSLSSSISAVASTNNGQFQSLALPFPRELDLSGSLARAQKSAGNMGLNNLPYDLLLNIATRLDIQDVHALHLVSVSLHLWEAEWRVASSSELDVWGHELSQSSLRVMNLHIRVDVFIVLVGEESLSAS